MWLAIYIPALPLQAFSHSLVESGPVAIYERDAKRNRIVASNKKAVQLGIKRDCSLAEANALCNHLISLPREPLRELARLQALATAVSHLTPNIHISEPFGLLLDISASLTLFGGAPSLLSEALISVDSQQLRAHSVIAPSARGARWLARAHRELVVTDRLDEWLDDLPLFATDLPLEMIGELQALNLHHLAAVRRLPTDQLGKRVGPALSLAMAQAYGHAAQSLPFWKPLTHFSERVEFLDLAREQSHWMPGITVLLQQLQNYLRQRASATTTIQFIFFHGTQQQTHLLLNAAHATDATQQWQRLFNAKLERTAIPHEISSIQLLCEHIEPMQFAELDFFDRSHDKNIQWQSLVALIKTRVGNQSVLESPHQNHNALPESTATLRGDFAAASNADQLRPTWLVEPPRRLYGDTLRKLFASLRMQHPERIQENWMMNANDQPAERDYYIAKSPDHCFWWIFRERAAGFWFLHGIFA